MSNFPLQIEGLSGPLFFHSSLYAFLWQIPGISPLMVMTPNHTEQQWPMLAEHSHQSGNKSCPRNPRIPALSQILTS